VEVGQFWLDGDRFAFDVTANPGAPSSRRPTWRGSWSATTTASLRTSRSARPTRSGCGSPLRRRHARVRRRAQGTEGRSVGPARTTPRACGWATSRRSGRGL